MKISWGKICLGVAILLTIISLTNCAKNKTTPKHVIFITVDTTRADYIGIYGSKRIKTPNLDALAKDSAVFKNCYSVTHTTIPSHTSLFTSLYLKDHGVISMGQILPDFKDFLPKLFKRVGYKTAAFTSGGHLSPAININQGFDDFFYPEKNENIAKKTADKVINWLDINKNAPFFIWTHFFDPHMRYMPPPPYDTMYKYTSNKTFNDYDVKNVHEFDKRAYLKYNPDPEFYRNLYRGEISYMDSQIGRVIEELKKLNIYDNSVIVLVADHGEFLGEHGLFYSHGGGIFNEVIHVPMFIKMENQKQKEMRTQLVSSIDIYPTLTEIFGLKISNPIRGKSLLSIIKNPASPEIRYRVYFEAVWRVMAGERTKDFTYIRDLYDVEKFKTVRGFMFPEKTKFVKNVKGRQKLFDNRLDGPQEHNLVDKKQKLARQFEEDILKFSADKINYHYKPGIVTDAKQLDKLKALGYTK